MTLVEIPILPESSYLELIELINRKMANAQKRAGFHSIAIHLNIYSRSNIEESRALELHVMLFQILVMRRLTAFGNKIARIEPHIKIYIEIQNSFLNKFLDSLDYLQERFITKDAYNYIKCDSTQLQGGTSFVGVPLKQDFDVLHV